ncbi:MAG: DUF4296 domain-containing protein [Bacteroidales bacterium]|jgi:hypothetical protein|nr:DUF4296 domain-containing protein [Bacteroidales bacterium]
MKEKPVPVKCSFSIVLMLCAVAVSSCVNPKDKIPHDDLIPEKTFISILSDIYLANGVLTVPDVRRQFASRDSVLNFIDIIESYGYSYEKMNNTINYYFISKPKKLIRIYDQVIGKMTETESALQDQVLKQSQAESRRATMSNIYYFPYPGNGEEPGIRLFINSSGTYTLSFTATVFPDDQSCDPHLSAWLVDADSIETGTKKWFPAIQYIKDGHPHHYVIDWKIRADRPLILRSVYYSHASNISEGEKHARIEVLFSKFVPNTE